MSTVADKIQLVKDAHDALLIMTDEDFVSTSYWQYILDNGGENFTAALSLFGFETVTRTDAIAILRHVLVVSYQYAWLQSSI